MYQNVPVNHLTLLDCESCKIKGKKTSKVKKNTSSVKVFRSVHESPKIIMERLSVMNACRESFSILFLEGEPGYGGNAIGKWEMRAQESKNPKKSKDGPQIPFVCCRGFSVI